MVCRKFMKAGMGRLRPLIRLPLLPFLRLLARQVVGGVPDDDVEADADARFF